MIKNKIERVRNRRRPKLRWMGEELCNLKLIEVA